MFKTTQPEFVPATDQLFSHCVTEDKMKNTFGKKNCNTLINQPQTQTFWPQFFHFIALLCPLISIFTWVSWQYNR